MEKTDAKDRINEEEDFVNLKRFSYSLKKLMERYPEGVPDKYIAQALDVAENEVPALYEEVVAKLRTLMNVEK